MSNENIDNENIDNKNDERELTEEEMEQVKGGQTREHILDVPVRKPKPRPTGK